MYYGDFKSDFISTDIELLKNKEEHKFTSNIHVILPW